MSRKILVKSSYGSVVYDPYENGFIVFDSFGKYFYGCDCPDFDSPYDGFDYAAEFAVDAIEAFNSDSDDTFRDFLKKYFDLQTWHESELTAEQLENGFPICPDELSDGYYCRFGNNIVVFHSDGQNDECIDRKYIFDQVKGEQK